MSEKGKRAMGDGAPLKTAYGTGFNDIHHTTEPAPLSNNTSLHIANLYGELVGFWLARCKALINSTDGEFNHAFERLIFFCALADHFCEVRGDT